MPEENENDVIIFDNLVQMDAMVAGRTVPVMAVRHVEVERFHQPNAKGELYCPATLDEVGHLAQEFSNELRAMFQL